MDSLFDLALSRYVASIRNFLIVLISAGTSFLLGSIVATTQSTTIWFYVAGLGVLSSVLVWPALAIVVYYPLIWPIWTYQFSLVGSSERVIGILAITGFAASLLRDRSRLAGFPITVSLGVFILIAANLLSVIAHSTPKSQEQFASLGLRMIFFYLVFFYLQNRKRLRWAIALYIVAGIVAGIITLIFSISLGFGFLRFTPQEQLLGNSSELLWTQIALNANLGTVPALFLLCLYPSAKSKFHQALILCACVFLFWMAFAAQYRREILISVPLLLLWFVIDKISDLRKPAFGLLALSSLVFVFIILPSPVLQRRLINETPLIESGEEIRIVSFRAGMTAFADSPLIGYGLGSYEETVAPIIGPVDYYYRYHAYNVFIWIAVESGILGLLGLIMILWGVYWQAHQMRQTNTGIENLVLRAAPALMAQIGIWYTFGNAFQVSIPWYLMGLILAAARIAKEPRGDTAIA